MLVNDRYIGLPIIIEKLNSSKLPGQEYNISDIKEWSMEAMEKLRLPESLVAHTYSPYISIDLTVTTSTATLPDDFDRVYQVLTSDGGVMTEQNPPVDDNTYYIANGVITTSFVSGTIELQYYTIYHHVDLTVTSYRAELPDNYHTLIALYEYTTRYPMLELSNNEPFKEMSFKLFNNYIYTDFEEGTVTLEYYSYPVDSNGWPLIPDKIWYISAIVAYIRLKIGEQLYWNGKILERQLNMLYQNWKECAGDTHAESKVISKEKLKRTMLRNFPAIDRPVLPSIT